MADLSLRTYSLLAGRTRPILPTVNDEYANAALGLVGEAAEVSEHFKKHLYQGQSLSVAKIRIELGDVMWYVDWIREQCGLTWDGILDGNIAKLKARYPGPLAAAERSTYGRGENGLIEALDEKAGRA